MRKMKKKIKKNKTQTSFQSDRWDLIEACKDGEFVFSFSFLRLTICKKKKKKMAKAVGRYNTKLDNKKVYLS